MCKTTLLNWLTYPILAGLDLDDPKTTILRKEIIQSKIFLKKIYDEWYQMMISSYPNVDGNLLELGSGGGFLGNIDPNVITSDVSFFPHVSALLDGQKMPLADKSLRAIMMVNVFHHLPACRLFLHEASRCVVNDGSVIMIEPWLTKWSLKIYKNYHHESFSPDTTSWEFASTGPLSGANGALPWIVFQRDRHIFEREFPDWRILKIEPFMPFRYLVSGGVSMRNFTPSWSFQAWKRLEGLLQPWMGHIAMFALIVLKKVN